MTVNQPWLSVIGAQAAEGADGLADQGDAGAICEVMVGGGVEEGVLHVVAPSGQVPRSQPEPAASHAPISSSER